MEKWFNGVKDVEEIPMREYTFKHPSEDFSAKISFPTVVVPKNFKVELGFSCVGLEEIPEYEKYLNDQVDDEEDLRPSKIVFCGIPTEPDTIWGGLRDGEEDSICTFEMEAFEDTKELSLYVFGVKWTLVE